MINSIDILNNHLDIIKINQEEEKGIITHKLLISVIPYPPGNIYIKYDKYRGFHIYSESEIRDIDKIL